jgi:hypothetical protein
LPTFPSFFTLSSKVHRRRKPLTYVKIVGEEVRMKGFKDKSWISFGAGFVVVLLGGWLMNFTPSLVRAPASLGSAKTARAPASVKRLDERNFPEIQDQTLLLWLRLDYQRVNGKKEFNIESHVVASPVLKLPRNGAQAYSTGRFTSVPIMDENGKFVENVEFENPNFTVEPDLLGPGQAVPAKDVRFEDGQLHSYFLRLPISEHLGMFRDVLKLGSESSARAEGLLSQKIKKLESIYILPAINAVIETESKSEASQQETATVRTNVLSAIALHFESFKTLSRLRQEANTAKEKIASSSKNTASNTTKNKNRSVANVDIPPATVRALSINDDNGNALSSRTTNRIKLVFLGDGFQQSEMETFFQAAQTKLDNIMQASAPGRVNPLAGYKGMFNAVAIFVPSNESGACHPEKGTPCPDTIFKTTFDVSGVQRLVGMTSGGSAPYSAVMQTYAPDYDLSVIIANDPTYGGGGGLPAYTSLDPNASDIVTHELFGHTFAHLGDEYADPYPGYPDTEEPNTTTNGDPATVKWAEWEQIDTKALTGNSSLVVGAPVEGAHYHATGWYRPAHNCKMAAYGIPFCPICMEAVIRALYSKAKPIDGVSPAAGDVDTSAGGWSLNVLTAPITSEISIQWTINGQPLDLSGAATFTSDSLSAALAQYPDIASKGAPYRVQAVISDNTPLVSTKGRQDGLLQDSVVWNLK